MSEKKRLLGMTLDELKTVAAEAGLPGFAAKQMADWLYKKRVSSIEEMTNIAIVKRKWLTESYEVGKVPPVDFRSRWMERLNICIRPDRVTLWNRSISRQATGLRFVFLRKWAVK